MKQEALWILNNMCTGTEADIKVMFELFPECSSSLLIEAIDKNLSEIAHHDFNDIKSLCMLF